MGMHRFCFTRQYSWDMVLTCFAQCFLRKFSTASHCTYCWILFLWCKWLPNQCFKAVHKAVFPWSPTKGLALKKATFWVPGILPERNGALLDIGFKHILKRYRQTHPSPIYSAIKLVFMCIDNKRGHLLFVGSISLQYIQHHGHHICVLSFKQYTRQCSHGEIWIEKITCRCRSRHHFFKLMQEF